MIDRDIKQFVLKALLHAKDQPVNDDTLKQLVRSAFLHVALTDEQLNGYIAELKAAGLIVSEEDAVFGTIWTLSLSGKPKAKLIP